MYGPFLGFRLIYTFFLMISINFSVSLEIIRTKNLLLEQKDDQQRDFKDLLPV